MCVCLGEGVVLSWASVSSMGLPWACPHPGPRRSEHSPASVPQSTNQVLRVMLLETRCARAQAAGIVAGKEQNTIPGEPWQGGQHPSASGDPE